MLTLDLRSLLSIEKVFRNAINWLSVVYNSVVFYHVKFEYLISNI